MLAVDLRAQKIASVPVATTGATGPNTSTMARESPLTRSKPNDDSSLHENGICNLAGTGAAGEQEGIHA